MKIKKITPNIIVNDVNANVAYYTKNFGFEVIATVPESGKLDFAMLTSGECTLMFQDKHIESTPSFKEIGIGSTITLYIDVDDVETLYKNLKNNEVDLLTDIFTTFYNTKEFVVKDLNGYILIFAQELVENQK